MITVTTPLSIKKEEEKRVNNNHNVNSKLYYLQYSWILCAMEENNTFVDFFHIIIKLTPPEIGKLTRLCWQK